MNKIKVFCKICGKTFKVEPYQVKIGKGKYCSKKCNKSFFKKNEKPIPHKIGCKCFRCGGIIKNKFKKGHIPWSKGKKLPQYSGAKNFNWKGGKRNVNGYIYIFNPKHPFTTKQGYIPESHFVMEKHLGRYLKSGEIVHHINNIHSDNRLKNLMLFPNKGAHNNFHKQIN